MDERKKIEERLRKKEQEMQSLEERLRAVRIYVQALQDVLKLLAPDSAAHPAISAQRDLVLRAGSAVAQARQVILDRREPVHISALLEALGKESTRESRASLTSSLAAYVRRGEIFTRPAPNTFGLVEMGHATSDSDEEDSPPSGFGAIHRIAAAAEAIASKSTVPAGHAPVAAKVEEDDEIPF